MSAVSIHESVDNSRLSKVISRISIENRIWALMGELRSHLRSHGGIVGWLAQGAVYISSETNPMDVWAAAAGLKPGAQAAKAWCSSPSHIVTSLGPVALFSPFSNFYLKIFKIPYYMKVWSVQSIKLFGIFLVNWH